AHGALQTTEVDRKRARIVAIYQVAKRRGQTLAQMAMQWVIRDPVVTSALIGASSVRQLDENLDALTGTPLAAEDLAAIDAACAA
ncbi:MAG: aldo/keto reductase, partial [Armatimonadota bacterium]